MNIINDTNNYDDNNIYEDDYDTSDINCEGGKLNYIYCKTLKQLFIKYNFDFTKIKYEPTVFISGNLTKYSIESRGDGFGIVIINHTNYIDDWNTEEDILGSFEQYPLEQLLELKVFIETWNKFTWGKVWNEFNIIKDIYNLLLAEKENIEVKKTIK